MKDRNSSSGRQQGDMGRQSQRQQSQHNSRSDDRQHKGSAKSQRQSSAHRTQQR